MSPPREERGSVAEAPPKHPPKRSDDFDPAEVEQAEHPDSFDPGLETGYLRRGARDHELPVEIGGDPFDPGPERYDGRRAKRAARRQEKAARKRRDRAERQAEQQRERVGAEREREANKERERLALERRQRDERARSERERQRRDDSLRAQRETREREANEKAERAHAERERLRRVERAERDRKEREREEQKRAEREQRDLALRQEREREARQRKQRERIERERAERRRTAREQKERAARERAARKRTKPASKTRPKSRSTRVRLEPTPPGRPKPSPSRVAGVPPSHTSLRRPTAKAAVAIAGVAVIALGMGALLGLPLPLLGGGEKTPASVPAVDPALVGIDPGTPIGLTKGPYHPVVNPTGYGEAAAKFHADRGGRKHEGQDVFGKPGTPLVAVRDAIVLDGAGAENFYSSGGGNTLVLYSPLDNRSYVYLHMLKPALVKAGDSVSAGQLVGQLGCTGSCDGPHLHFEVRNGRADFGAETKAVDPLPLIQQWPARPTG